MRNAHGQIAVELAILLPLAFFLIFILAELCFLFNARQLLFLGSFQAARSYLVRKEFTAAETALKSAISPAIFRETAAEAAYLKVTEKGDAVTAEAVLLYRPLFPVLPLARLMNRAFFPERNSALVGEGGVCAGRGRVAGETLLPDTRGRFRGACKVKNNQGQVLIILLFFIPPLLFLLFSVANTTLAVRDRLKLQNSADAAALSAAAWQAKGLNQIAEANAVIEAGDLLEKYVSVNKPGSAKTKAKIMIIEAEKKQMEFVKQDILKRLPGYAGEAAATNGLLTLTGETPAAGLRDDAAMHAPDFGARAFGVSRDLKLVLGPDGEFDPELNRVFGVSWRKRALAGVAGHLFGRMAVPPGYALSGAAAASEKNGTPDKVLVPYFRPGLAPVRMTPDDFDFFRKGFSFIAGKDAYEDVAGKILH